MTQLSLALIHGVQSLILGVATLVAILIYGHASTAKPVHTPDCFIAVTTVVSRPNPYRIARVVTSGVRRYEDDGTGTVSYCAPRDPAKLDAARAAVDRRVEEQKDSAGQNRERVIIRSTSPGLAGDHLKYVAAGAAKSGAAFAGVEVVQIGVQDGTRSDDVPLASLLATDSARAACAKANAELKRVAATFHWAC